MLSKELQSAIIHHLLVPSHDVEYLAPEYIVIPGCKPKDSNNVDTIKMTYGLKKVNPVTFFDFLDTKTVLRALATLPDGLKHAKNLNLDFPRRPFIVSGIHFSSDFYDCKGFIPAVASMLGYLGMALSIYSLGYYKVVFEYFRNDKLVRFYVFVPTEEKATAKEDEAREGVIRDVDYLIRYANRNLVVMKYEAVLDNDNMSEVIDAVDSIADTIIGLIESFEPTEEAINPYIQNLMSNLDYFKSSTSKKYITENFRKIYDNAKRLEVVDLLYLKKLYKELSADDRIAPVDVAIKTMGKKEE